MVEKSTKETAMSMLFKARTLIRSQIISIRRDPSEVMFITALFVAMSIFAKYSLPYPLW